MIRRTYRSFRTRLARRAFDRRFALAMRRELAGGSDLSRERSWAEHQAERTAIAAFLVAACASLAAAIVIVCALIALMRQGL